MIIAINALNSNSGGGESIRNSYLTLLNKEKLNETYFVIASNKADIGFIKNKNIKIIEMGMVASSSIFAPIVYGFLLGRLLKKISHRDLEAPAGHCCLVFNGRAVKLSGAKFILAV